MASGTDMAEVYVSVGSNVEPERQVRSCLRALRERYGALRVSTIYRSKAVGFTGADFLNLVVQFDTDEEVRQVVSSLHAVEAAHGRHRKGPKFSDRSLDLDLLLYDDLILAEPGLHLPRDEITRYAFVLRPLAELTGERRHPILGRTFNELWQAMMADAEPMIPVGLQW
ncbi:MAG TPA: 2-amino-4-hydroxy-6-hydroxymethyldihydropteridine diphosphokinase [Candidatus Competibacteraceae bacterium]|nr:2-amino-4-hydroxy-6-hydroxymethyldihydropteridine diphosphokinase [Candidatus Competibacteraceae bacterium]